MTCSLISFKTMILWWFQSLRHSRYFFRTLHHLNAVMAEKTTHMLFVIRAQHFCSFMQQWNVKTLTYKTAATLVQINHRTRTTRFNGFRLFHKLFLLLKLIVHSLYCYKNLIFLTQLFKWPNVTNPGFDFPQGPNVLTF